MILAQPKLDDSKQQDRTLAFGKATALTMVMVATAVALAEILSLCSRLVSPPWLAAVIIHTFLATLVLLWHFSKDRHCKILAFESKPQVALLSRSPFAKLPFGIYAPAASVLLGAMLLVSISRQFGSPSHAETPVIHLAWVIWVPIVEEVVYRGGVMVLLLQRISLPWAAWFSAVLFALVHSQPTIAALSKFEFGIPLGPFLLGLATAAIFGLSNRLLPAIALHAACNMTAQVFAIGDDRWLDWLHYLYL